MSRCMIALLVLAAASGCAVSQAISPAQPILVPSHTVIPHRISEELIHPEDFVYLGAFRLPEGREPPFTFAYGGAAMTWIPGTAEKSECLPGSLIVMGHNRMPYGELPDGNQAAEITIAKPLISKSLDDLNRASFIRDFHTVDTWFSHFDEIPRVGMEYLDDLRGPGIHISWGQHFHDDEYQVPTHAWYSLDTSDIQGPWIMGNHSAYSTNSYIFAIPAQWADAHAGGSHLAAGRFRDGGWSGMGPSLFAYTPWTDESGTATPAQTSLVPTVLLLYQSSTESEHIQRAMDGYQHGDEWEGGAWITTASGKQGVLFAGTKSTGERYWYGFINPLGSEYPCIQEDFIGEFILCRLADGTPCPDEASWVCTDPASGRGWWSTSFSAWFILYNPEDLASVARGTMKPWEPQPYAHIVLDEYLFFNPSGVDRDILGTGDQRRYRIGDTAFDREHGLLYVLELFADEAQPVIHVWKVN